MADQDSRFIYICLFATAFGGNSVHLYAKRHTIVTSRLYRRLNGYFEKKKIRSIS